MAEAKKKTEKVDLSDFERLYQMDVSEWTEKKKSGSTELTYLSWANMVRLMTNEDPDWTYKILEFNDNGELVEYGRPYRKTVGGGYEVRTRITFKGRTKEMWLPVLDNQNLPMRDEGYQKKYKNYTVYVEPINSMALNTSQMRCLVKNAAMFGLGLYIYAGEDLPSDLHPVPDDKPQEKVTIDKDTGEVKVEVKKEDKPLPNGALAHVFEEGPRNKDGQHFLKNVPIIKFKDGFDGAYSKKQVIAILEKGMVVGTDNDKKACSIIVDLIKNGTLEFDLE